jgi:hypothetical protein
MQIMMKSILAVACLAVPLATLAVEAKPPAKPAPAAASAPAAAAAAKHTNSREAVRASKERGSAMGACQKQAADQRLTGVERKQFLTTCLKTRQPSKK